MEKLTLEQIAPYLPYKLVLGLTHSHAPIICTGLTIHEDGIMAHHKKGSVNVSLEKWYKPILRPMSDFDDPTKYHNEDNYSFMAEFNKSSGIIDIDRDLDFEIEERSHITYLNCSNALMVYDFLFKHHFDVFDLIEKGLAISIHDLKTT